MEMCIQWYNIISITTAIIFLMPWYFIPRVLKLANVKMYVWNGYDGDSETVKVLARHTALKRWIATEILLLFDLCIVY